MSVREPNIKDKTVKGEPTTPEVTFITDLRAAIKQDYDDQAEWKIKLATASNQRLGIKRWSSSPYANAPDIPLPETDKLIIKSTPNLVLSAWSPKTLCAIKPYPGTQIDDDIKEKAKKAETVTNMILRNEIDWYDKLELSADYAKEKGIAIFRTIHKFETRIVNKVIDLSDYDKEAVTGLREMKNKDLKQWISDRYDFDLEDDDDKATLKDIIDQFRGGADVIDFNIEEITSHPDIEVPLPSKVIVPAYTTDIGRAERITYEYDLSRHELEQYMATETFIDHDLDELEYISGGDDKDVIERAKMHAEGVSDNTSQKDLFTLQEVCCWHKPDPEKPSERWVFTFFKDVLGGEEALLQKIPFPFEFDEWNYDRYDNERKDPRHYNSRGVPERVRAIQETMERIVNNTLIRDEINNLPVFEVLSTSKILDRNKYFVPGEFVPVTGIGQEIAPLTKQSGVDISSERLMQTLKAYAEEYLGNNDQLFKNATNKGGGNTLGEVQEGIQQNSGIHNVEVIRWNETLSKVYRKFFAIMKERFGDTMYVEDSPVTREDFEFKADVRSNGTLEVSNEQRATMKAFARLNAITHPNLQDCVNSEDKYHAVQDWLEKDGVKDPDHYSTDPKIIAQEQIAQLQQQVQELAGQLQQLQKETQKAEVDLQKTKKSTAKEAIKDMVTLDKEVKKTKKGVAAA